MMEEASAPARAPACVAGGGECYGEAVGHTGPCRCRASLPQEPPCLGCLQHCSACGTRAAHVTSPLKPSQPNRLMPPSTTANCLPTSQQTRSGRPKPASHQISPACAAHLHGLPHQLRHLAAVLVLLGEKLQQLKVGGLQIAVLAGAGPLPLLPLAGKLHNAAIGDHGVGAARQAQRGAHKARLRGRRRGQLTSQAVQRRRKLALPLRGGTGGATRTLLDVGTDGVV